MTLDGQAILDALKAQALPIVAADAVKVVNIVLDQIQAQAVAQSGDVVASVIAIALPEIKTLIDQELAAVLPQA